MFNKFEEIKKTCQGRTDLDQKRLNSELEQIKKMGLVENFYEFYTKKKQGNENKVNSLVAFALRITSKHPEDEFKPHKKFESGRVGLPDIDLDFTDRRRDEVIEYVAQKYGRDKVAQIITFGTMASRAVVRDVGRVLGYSYSYCDKIAKMIPFGLTLDETLARVDEFRQTYLQDDKAQKLIDFAKKLEGCARHASTHACGVVISAEPLDDLVPLQHPTQNDKAIVTQYEMNSIEDLGLLKMDFLGLKNLTIIEDTLARIYKVQGKSIDIENIPLQDKATYKLLEKGETVGVFQLESSMMRHYLKQLKPTEIEDIIAMVALYRPGPMALIPEYIAGKHKKKKIEYLHPKLKPILESTYNICIYQEQVMKVAQELAGFSLSEADVLRKAIGKKIKKLLLAQKEKFIEGCKKNQISENIAQKIWNWIEPFARYSFNRCLSGDTEIIDGKSGQKLMLGEIAEGKSLSDVISLNRDLKLQKSSTIKVFRNGIKPVYTVTTRLGKQIKATLNHPFLTVNGWRVLGELKPGDRIALARKIPIKNKKLSNIKNHQLVVLGYILAEGNFCHPYGFYFFSNNSEQRKDYLMALKKFKNTKGRIDMKRKSAPSIYAGRINLKEESEAVKWVESIGLKYKRATQKEFPEFVFQLNEKQVALLLAKMFEGDGCINLKRKYPQVFYATSSQKLACQFQHLLLRLGIISTLHEKKFKYRGGIERGYTLTINRYENLEKLYHYFGPHLLNETRKKLEKIIKNHPIISGKIKKYSARGSKDIIPVEIREIIRKEVKKKGYSSFKQCAKENGFSERLLWRGLRKKGYLRETLQMIGEKLNSKIIQKYAHSDLYWDEIIKIEPSGKEETYDLTIQGTHNFLANDFIVHNSHSAAYALIAYQTAYLKALYPVEFMASLLTSEKADVERIGFLISECKKMGIEVLPPDINESLENFTVIPPDKIRFGLLAIKNVGWNVVKAIVRERKNSGTYQTIFNFVSRVNSKDLNKKSLESLIKAGVFDRLVERNQLLSNLEKLLQICRENQKVKANGQKGLFDGISSNSEFRLSPTNPASKAEKLVWEKELLGLFVTSHPLEDFKKVLEKKVLPLTKITQDLTGKIVKVGGVISSIKKIVTKSGRPMLFTKLEDESTKIEVVVFPGIIEKNPGLFRENKIVMIKGRVDNRDGVPKIICEEIEEIVES